MSKIALKPTNAQYIRYAKILFAIATVEVLAIVSLLVLALPAKHTNAPTTGQQTPKNTTETLSKLELKQVASGLKSPTTIAATNDTNDKRLFIAEQDGAIRIITAAGKVDPTVFLDITPKVLSGGEMGLLGLAFHPKLDKNPYFFINYIDKQQHTIIARYTISQQTGRANPASEKVLIKLKQPYPNHNGGQLAFGPDGYLYIGLGDGGSGGDPKNRAQNKNELFGKILRIDVDKGNPYAIPKSNPFIKSEGKPEVWAYGLRNPWRFSFDHQTGDLYIADVGQHKYEEINFQTSASKGGENYGWRCYEALHTYNTDGCADATAYTPPILEHDHSEERCSITGGYVYRGSQNPAMAGKYFYGDYCSGQIYYTQRLETWQPALLATTSFSISTFGQDSSGELYLADLELGTIYRLTQ